MPSLKMKTKSTTGCLREKNGLHVCQKSNMISKNPCFRVQKSQQAAELDASIRKNQHVSLCIKTHAQEVGDDKAIDQHELLVEENLEFQKHLPPLTDSVIARRMESAQTTCVSNLETIFSAILESIEGHSEPDVNIDPGSKTDLDGPVLGANDSDDSSRSSCEYQTCNVSDFYTSDMIVAGLPIEGNSVYDGITDTTWLLDYKCDEASMLFDVAEEYMILPFLEDIREPSSDYDGRTCENTIIDSDDSSLYLAIHQLRSCNQETEKMKSITLVLDLDETLVHSTLEHCEDADFTFSVFFNMKDHTVYVKQRPYLQMFLERVAEMFEIVVFTASQSIYADQLLDILDPDGKFLSRRAYRESCNFLDGNYTKDLTILGVDLAKVAIIDNSPQVFQLQVNNGIPIKSWFDDPSDCALISLLPFLETLVDADDVRPIISERFGNKE